MNHLRTILAALLFAAAPAAAQTIKTLGYNTTNGNVVAATNLTFTNSLTVATASGSSLSIGNTNLQIRRDPGSGSLVLTANANTNTFQFRPNGTLEISGPISFGSTTNAAGYAATTRTNLGGTAVGNAVFTATNAAAAANAIGLGTTNNVTFNIVSTIQLEDSGQAKIDVDDMFLVNTNAAGNAAFDWGGPTLAAGLPISFSDATNAAITRTNLGLGATNNVTFSNVTATGTLGVSNAATFSTNVTVNGNVTTSGTLTATGNVTMSGTANTAPNQTASSGSSLMTRDLSDDRYSFSRWYGPQDLQYAEHSAIPPTIIRGNDPGWSPVAGFMITVVDNNVKWSLPLDYRVNGQVRVVSYWTDRILTNSGGTNADIAVWTLPSAVQPTSNTGSNNLTTGTQIKTVYTANYGGTGNSRFYVVDQLLDFGTITNISATNPMQIKYVELQRRGLDATDTSTNSIYLSGVHIYVP